MKIRNQSLFSRQCLFFLFMLSLVAFGHQTLLAGECIRNGNFDQVTAYWSLSEALGNNIPYKDPQACIALEVSGDVFHQPLNIDDIGGQTFTLSVDVGAMWPPTPGQSVEVYLDYLTSSGTCERVLVLNPDNSTVPGNNPVDPSTFATFSSNYTFAATADRLVGLTIARNEWDTFYIDNVSLTSSTQEPGEIPHITTPSVPSLEYGDTITLEGSELGTNGTLLIGGYTNGVSVTSWSPTSISATVEAPCSGGRIELDVNGTGIWQKRTVSMVSPHYKATLDSGPYIAIAGQLLTVPIDINFAAGYTTAGLSFSVADRQSSAAFSPSSLSSEGSVVLRYDTSGLPPGIHTCQILATDELGSGPIGTVDVDIRQVDHVEITSYGTPLPSTISNGVPQTYSAVIEDTQGLQIEYDIPIPVWSSSNPSVIEIFRDRPTTPWGDLYILPHASGTATLRATFPDASQFDFPVTVSLPASPQMTTLAWSLPTMSNDPTVTNRLSITTTDRMTYLSTSRSDLSIDSVNSSWGSGNLSHTTDYQLDTEHHNPGTYLLRAYADVSTASGEDKVGDGVLLTIVNDPNTGLITGDVFVMDAPFPEISGTLDLFTVGETNTPAVELSLWQGSSRYMAPRIDPGSYLVRFSSDFSGESIWYPSATSASNALPVTVTAGTTVDHIDFVFGSASETSAPPIDTAPSISSGTTFEYGVTTESGKSYVIQKSYTLSEGSWFTADTLWGSGGSETVSDNIETSENAFYRVLPE